jgi:hypothetical protein
MHSLFDSGFAGIARAAMYQEWTAPGINPDERQPVLQNWSDEDKEAFCGIYKNGTND